MPMTRKPCPGCGRTERREADQVCSRCQYKFKALDELVAAIEASEGSEVVIGPTRSYAHEGLYEGNADQAKREQLREALHQLLRSVAITAPQGASYRYWESILSTGGRRSIPSKDWTGLLIVPVGFLDAWNDLDLAIAETVCSAYNAGLARGSNLLLGLARGEITVDKFNEGQEKEATLSEERQKRKDKAK